MHGYKPGLGQGQVGSERRTRLPPCEVRELDLGSCSLLVLQPCQAHTLSLGIQGSCHV